MSSLREEYEGRLEEILKSGDLEGFRRVLTHGFFTARDMEEPHGKVAPVFRSLLGKDPSLFGANLNLIIRGIRDIPDLEPEKSGYDIHCERGFAYNLLMYSSWIGRNGDVYSALRELIKRPDMKTQYRGIEVAVALRCALMSAQTDRDLLRTWRDMLDQVETPSEGSSYAPGQDHPNPFSGNMWAGFDGLVRVAREGTFNEIDPELVSYALMSLSSRLMFGAGFESSDGKEFGHRVGFIKGVYGVAQTKPVLEMVLGDSALPVGAKPYVAHHLESP